MFYMVVCLIVANSLSKKYLNGKREYLRLDQIFMCVWVIMTLWSLMLMLEVNTWMDLHRDFAQKEENITTFLMTNCHTLRVMDWGI